MSIISENKFVSFYENKKNILHKDNSVLRFLEFLDRDMDKPNRTEEIDPSLIEYAKHLTIGVQFDLDMPLSDEDE